MKLAIGYVSRNRPMSAHTRLKFTSLAVAISAVTGCASRRAPAATGEPASVEAPTSAAAVPLAAMAGRPVVVLPVQYVTFVDSVSGRQNSPLAVQYLASMDDSIASALADRGLTSWTFARGITASARRNEGMTADPHALSAERFRRLVKAGDDALPEPLGSQIRSLVALREARYVILPAALRIENRIVGGRGSLLVYLIDTRTERVAWSGEVRGEGTLSIAQAIGRTAQHLADLVTAR